MTIRYGARPPEQQRNREVEATSRQDLVDRGDRRVGDRSRRDPRGAAAAARTVGAARAHPVRDRRHGHRHPDLRRRLVRRARPARQRRRASTRSFMPMTTEQATVGGRETFGEPKKIGGVAIDVDGDHVHARLRPDGLPARGRRRHARRAGRHPAPRTRSTSTSRSARRPTARASTPSPRSCTCAGTKRRATAARSTATLDAARLAARSDRRHPGRAHRLDAVRAGRRPRSTVKSSSGSRPTGCSPTCTSATTTCRCSARRTRSERHAETTRYTIISADAHAGLPVRGVPAVPRHALPPRSSTSSSPSGRRTATSR